MLKIFLLFFVTSRASAGPGMWDFLGDIYEEVKDSVTSGARDEADDQTYNGAEKFLDYLDLLEDFRETMLDNQDYYHYYIVARDYASRVEPDYRINDVYDYTRHILYDAGQLGLAAEEIKEFRGVVDMYLDDMRFLRVAGP